MKLSYKYKIYWFENEEGWLDSAIAKLEEKYEESKIEFEIVKFKNKDGIDGITPTTEIDIVLMDYNLTGVKGDEIISILRERDILCDVIFYSQNANFDDELKDREGVQTTARNNLSGELNKRIDNHKLTIENVSTFRGTFITSAIDLELKMNEIISSFFSLNSDKELFFKQEIIETDFFHVGAKLKVVARIGREILKDLDETVAKSSDEKKLTLNKTKTKLQQTINIFKRYPDEIMHVRNTLAHSKDGIHEDGSSLFIHNTMKTQYVINESWVREKMKHLVVHSINLDRLLTFI